MSIEKCENPIFLTGEIEVEGQDQGRVQEELRESYKTLERKFHEYKGYLGEIFMAQMLWNSQNTILSGRFFHSEQDLKIPCHFSYIRHRMRLQSGKGREIDLIGAADDDI